MTNDLSDPMIRKLFLTVVIIAFSLTASAQALKFSAGIKATVVANMMTTGEKPQGFGGGAFANLKIANLIGVQADALYSRTSHTIANDLTGTYCNVSHDYLLVPVVSQIWLGRVFAIELGYQQAIVLSGKIQTTKGKMDDKGIFDYGSVVAGVNISLGKVAAFSVRYTHGLDYSYVAKVDPAKNFGLQAGLGFNLFRSRKTIFK